MPRGARLGAPGTLHRVMVRGIEGENIVADDEDRRFFVVLSEAVLVIVIENTVAGS